MPTWALATHPHQGEVRAAHLGAVEGKMCLSPAVWAVGLLCQGTPGQASPFNPEEPVSPPSPQGGTHSLPLSLIMPWVRLGPRFLLWEGPGNTGFS